MRESNMKKSILINGKKIKTKIELYTYLESQFSLPTPMGHNLDALWDVLSHNQSIQKITFIHTKEFKQNLSEYADSFIELLQEIQLKRNIEIKLFEGKRNENN